MTDMSEALRAGVVEVRTRPHVSTPWKPSNVKGGPVTVKHKWTRQTAVAALQEWAKAHGGRAPRQHELGRHASPPLPSTHHIKEWGLRQLVVEAGLPPAPKGQGGRRKPRHQDNGGPAVEPSTDEYPEGFATDPTSPGYVDPNHDAFKTPLERLVADLTAAEGVLAKLRAPYIEARDNVQLLRLEIIELLQKEDSSE